MRVIVLFPRRLVRGVESEFAREHAVAKVGRLVENEAGKGDLVAPAGATQRGRMLWHAAAPESSVPARPRLDNPIATAMARWPVLRLMMPGSHDEAAELLDAFLARSAEAETDATAAAQTAAHPARAQA